MFSNFNFFCVVCFRSIKIKGKRSSLSVSYLLTKLRRYLSLYASLHEHIRLDVRLFYSLSRTDEERSLRVMKEGGSSASLHVDEDVRLRTKRIKFFSLAGWIILVYKNQTRLAMHKTYKPAGSDDKRFCLYWLLPTVGLPYCASLCASNHEHTRRAIR
jgi:hypothetical protein